jgi:hypothetical protein
MKMQQTAYNMPGAYAITGPLDVEALRQAFCALIERHESLRTSFVAVSGEPMQKIHPAVPFPLQYLDVRTAASPDKLVNNLMLEETDFPFDLERVPLLRATLLRVGEEAFVLVFNIHHIIADGQSAEVMVNELLLRYAAHREGVPAALPALAIHYKDFADWHNQQLSLPQMDVHRQYWLRKFAGEPPVLELPTDYRRPAVRTYIGANFTTSLGRTLTGDLQQFARTRNASLFMVLLTGVEALLYRYTKQEDIVVGTVSSGRVSVDLENQIGCFLNTLALRTKIKASDCFVTLLDKVKQEVISAFEHELYPFDLLVSELALKRDPGRSVLFDVQVSLQTVEPKATQIPREGTIHITHLNIDFARSKYDMTINFEEADGDLTLSIQYNTSLFDPASVHTLAKSLVAVFENCLRNPFQHMADLVLTPGPVPALQPLCTQSFDFEF